MFIKETILCTKTLVVYNLMFFVCFDEDLHFASIAHFVFYTVVNSCKIIVSLPLPPKLKRFFYIMKS